MIRIRKWKSGIPELETEKLQEKFRNFSKQLAMAPSKDGKRKAKGGKAKAAASQEDAEPPAEQVTGATMPGMDTLLSPRDGAAPEPRTPGDI